MAIPIKKMDKIRNQAVDSLLKKEIIKRSVQEKIQKILTAFSQETNQEIQDITICRDVFREGSFNIHVELKDPLNPRPSFKDVSEKIIKKLSFFASTQREMIKAVNGNIESIVLFDTEQIKIQKVILKEYSESLWASSKHPIHVFPIFPFTLRYQMNGKIVQKEVVEFYKIPPNISYIFTSAAYSEFILITIKKGQGF